MPSSIDTLPAGPKPFIVACLCAAWCGVCGDYRAQFDRLKEAYGGAHFVWIDIEDEAELLGPIDVEDFPTLLIAEGERPLFFGTLTPQPETLERLLRACMGSTPPQVQADAAVAGLAARLATLLHQPRA